MALAVSKGQFDSLSILAEFGADLDIENEQGETPLHIACKRNDKASTRLLVEKNCNIHKKSKEGLTAAMICASDDKYDCLFYLMMHGANPQTPDKCGFTIGNYFCMWIFA